MKRRKFISASATAAAAFTIVPRHVMGGGKYVAPSDTITLAYIGMGTQGIREMLPMLAVPNIRITSICDCNRSAVGYRDWGISYLKDGIRKALNKPEWEPGGDNTIPGGRENGKAIVDTYYSTLRPELKYKGCSAYEDARELLDKEKVDAVKIITPDHTHGVFAMAAIRRGKHVLVHKPLSNRLTEGKRVIEMARSSKVITHLIPWDANENMDTVMGWINAGAIGTLREVHNWTSRPVWPQYTELPKGGAPVPDGFNWDLWLGPEANRDYSPDYTHMTFRGWYDFGGGSMADMGHYSLWTVFNALQLTSPSMIIPNRSHVCTFNGQVPSRVANNFSFPLASTVRFKYPANGNRPPIDLCWYDGGMKPPTPDELLSANTDLASEGMMFVGTEGKILAEFHGRKPQIISGRKMEGPPETEQDTNQVSRTSLALPKFVEAVRTGEQYPGSFREAGPLTEAVNLYAVALRVNKTLSYDATSASITNVPEANQYLSRTYRPGWENI